MEVDGAWQVVCVRIPILSRIRISLHARQVRDRRADHLNWLFGGLKYQPGQHTSQFTIIGTDS